MPVFQIPGTQIQPGALRTSAPVTPGADFDGAEIRLVDTNNQWPATRDPTRHVRLFGLQQSFDGGANWQWGPVWAGHPQGDPNVQFSAEGADYWTQFGHRRRDGAMPGIAFSASQVVGLGTTMLRLAIFTDSVIRLGATITTVRNGN